VQTLLPLGWHASCPPYAFINRTKGRTAGHSTLRSNGFVLSVQLSSRKETLCVPHSGPPLFTKVNVGQHHKGSLSLTRNSKKKKRVQRWSTCFYMRWYAVENPHTLKYTNLHIIKPGFVYVKLHFPFKYQNTTEDVLSTISVSAFGSS
jgi:hypothetical protein